MKPALLLSLAVALLAPAGAHSQIPGTRETFTHERNADSWAIFDYFDSSFYFPEYDLAGDGVNPDIWFTFTGDSPLDFMATALSSDGAFTGDYFANEVYGVGCDVYTENASVITRGEFFLLSTATNEYYFSDIYVPDTDGWQSFFASFRDEPWYVIEGNVYVEVFLTPAILAQVTQIGFTLYPDSTAAEGLAGGIDNFTLYADLVAPAVSTTADSGALGLSFQRKPGLTYTIKSSPDLTGWTAVSGQTDITGSTPYFFSQPFQPGSMYFEVELADKLTEVPEIDAP